MSGSPGTHWERLSGPPPYLGCRPVPGPDHRVRVTLVSRPGRPEGVGVTTKGFFSTVGSRPRYGAPRSATEALHRPLQGGGTRRSPAKDRNNPPEDGDGVAGVRNRDDKGVDLREGTGLPEVGCAERPATAGGQPRVDRKTGDRGRRGYGRVGSRVAKGELDRSPVIYPPLLHAGGRPSTETGPGGRGGGWTREAAEGDEPTGFYRER